MPATAVHHRSHTPTEFDFQIAPITETHAHYHGVAEAAPSSRARFAGAHRRAPHTHDVDQLVEGLSQDETELLLRRILEDEPLPLSADELLAEASRARRRARPRHRPFRLTKAQCIIAGTLLCQLTGVLWWQSQALSLRNRDQRLKNDIAITSQQIAQTKNAISQLDSEGNLSQLAAQMQWSRAPVNNFDDVSKTRRLMPEEAAAIGNSATGDGSEAAFAPEPVDQIVIENRVAEPDVRIDETH